MFDRLVDGRVESRVVKNHAIAAREDVDQRRRAFPPPFSGSSSSNPLDSRGLGIVVADELTAVVVVEEGRLGAVVPVTNEALLSSLSIGGEGLSSKGSAEHKPREAPRRDGLLP